MGTLGDAADGCLSDPKEITTKLRVNYVDETLDQCEICRPFLRAPDIPTAELPTVSMFNEKLRAGWFPLDDATAPRATDAYSKYSLLAPVRPKNSQEVWGVPAGRGLPLLVGRSASDG